MKILKLYIRNCGVFKNTLIDFTRDGEPNDLICLAGVNGSGKTTVMELVFNLISFIDPGLSLRNIFYDRLKPNVLTRTEFAQLDVLIEDKVLSLVLGDKDNRQKDPDFSGKQGFIMENEFKSMVKQFEDAVIKAPEDEEEPQIIKRLMGLQEAERFSARKVDKLNIKVLDQLLVKITENRDPNIPVVYFFNAHDREIRDIRYSSISQGKNGVGIAHRYSPRRDDLTKTLVFYDYAYPEEFQKLKDWVNQHVLVGKSIDKIDRPDFKVVIKTKDESEHGLELLSLGEENLLIIATQLYLRASKDTIMLIDEVDQDLHPEFQQKVMRVLKQLQKDKNCRIIVSSHSDIIWDAVEEEDIIDLTEMVL